jgi:hypothetical protein
MSVMGFSAESRLVWSLALLLALTGCAHYQIPVNHLETPEARGDDGIGRIELSGILQGNDLIEPPSLSTPAPDSTELPTAQVQKTFMGSFGFVWSASDSLDIGIRMTPQAPLTLRLKYQVQGKPQTKAAPGEFSTAISFSPGVLWGGLNGQTTNYFSGDLALISGYRLSEENLVIFSPFIGVAQLTGIPLTGTSATVNNPEALGSASLTQYGAALGLQHTLESMFVRVECTYTKGSFGDAKISGFYLGSLVGFDLL